MRVAVALDRGVAAAEWAWQERDGVNGGYLDDRAPLPRRSVRQPVPLLQQHHLEHRQRRISRRSVGRAVQRAISSKSDSRPRNAPENHASASFAKGSLTIGGSSRELRRRKSAPAAEGESSQGLLLNTDYRLNGHRYIVVTVRLFANLGAPIYRVVVGERHSLQKEFLFLFNQFRDRTSKQLSLSLSISVNSLHSGANVRKSLSICQCNFLASCSIWPSGGSTSDAILFSTMGAPAASDVSGSGFGSRAISCVCGVNDISPMGKVRSRLKRAVAEYEKWQKEK